MSKDTVESLNTFETIKIKPNEFGTDEVANRPHAYLEENDIRLETAIENFSISDLADVVDVTDGPHVSMPMSGDEYTPHFLSRTGTTSGEWNSDTFTQEYIDHLHPALTDEGKCRVGDGSWYIQDTTGTVIQVKHTQADFTPIAVGTTYIYGFTDIVRRTNQQGDALSNVPIAKGYSSDGVTFDTIEDMRPIYTPAQLSAIAAPSGAIIAQYTPWSLTFTINSANSGMNTQFTFPEPYLAGKGLLNVYLNGIKQPVQDINNPLGTYTEISPYSIAYNDLLEVGDMLILHSDLGYIRNVGMNADFEPGSIALEMPADESIGYIEELPFNFPSGMHMLHVFRNGVRLTSGLDYDESANGQLDNKSITYKIPLYQGDIIVYHCPTTFVTNLSLTADEFNYVEIMHGASDAYKNYSLTEHFDGINTPSLSGQLSDMHFKNLQTISSYATHSGPPKVTEFDLMMGIGTSLSGAYENIGQFSGQITWGGVTNLVETRGIWTGYNSVTFPAATATSFDLPSGELMTMELGDATYGLQLDYLTRSIDHIGLIGLSGAEALSGTEQFLSTVELKNFRSNSGDTVSKQYLEWMSFNTQIPLLGSNPKSLVTDSWSIFNSGYPTDSTSMNTASAIFDNDMTTELSIAGQNYETSSRRDAHLDVGVTLDWANQLVYISGTLKSHRGYIYAIGETFAMGNAAANYDVWFSDEAGSTSTGRPKFIFNLQPNTRKAIISFQAGEDGFENTNTSKWSFTTLANRQIVENIPALADRLTVPGAYYLTTAVNYSGKIDNTGTTPPYGSINSSRVIEGYNTSESIELTEATLFPIIIPPDTHRTELEVKTKQFAIYDGVYNILIDWLNYTFTLTYEGLLIRDSGFNIVGKESGSVNTLLKFGSNSTRYKYDELGETYPTGNQGNFELPTTIEDQVTRIGTLDVQLNTTTGVRTITTLPIIEAISVNPSYFDVKVRNYKSLNG